MTYSKLVRDKIPDMIKAQEEIPHVRILAQEEYTRSLEQKLDEVDVLDAAEKAKDGFAAILRACLPEMKG